MKHKIEIDFTDSPELAEYFSRQEIGKRVTLQQVVFQIMEVHPDRVVGSVEGIRLTDDDKLKSEEKGELTKPVAITIMIGEQSAPYVPAVTPEPLR